MENPNHPREIPFLTPADYFSRALHGSYEAISTFPALQSKDEYWTRQDADLHVYPYTRAIPALFSVGCANRCAFCPSALLHKGKVHFADYERIAPWYNGKAVHFMDEDFFANDLRRALPPLRRARVEWLGMATAANLEKALDEFGEDHLWDHGCRVVEVGLESVICMKVRRPFNLKRISVYYLNMTFLPGETSETIKATAAWMKGRSLKRPIHFNNGLWYAPGQFFYPYVDVKEMGVWLPGRIARTRPTWVPMTFLESRLSVVSMERVNFFSQLVYDFKLYPDRQQGPAEEWLRDVPPADRERMARWLAVGLRCGGIK